MGYIMLNEVLRVMNSEGQNNKQSWPLLTLLRN